MVLEMHRSRLCVIQKTVFHCINKTASPNRGSITGNAFLWSYNFIISFLPLTKMYSSIQIIKRKLQVTSSKNLSCLLRGAFLAYVEANLPFPCLLSTIEECLKAWKIRSRAKLLSIPLHICRKTIIILTFDTTEFEQETKPTEKCWMA